MVYSLEEIRKIAVPIAEKYGVQRIGLFGSYARGDQNEHSDLDFLIQKGKMRGLVQYMGFVLDLEDAFGCHVDVVTDGIDDQSFLETIRKEEILIYEAN